MPQATGWTHYEMKVEINKLAAGERMKLPVHLIKPAIDYLKKVHPDGDYTVIGIDGSNVEWLENADKASMDIVRAFAAGPDHLASQFDDQP